MTGILNAIGCVFTAAGICAWVLGKIPDSSRLSEVWLAYFFAADICWMIADLISGDIWWIWWAVIAALSGRDWWDRWRKNRRKRRGLVLGAKSRALIDAMVRAMKERSRPRRVLRPVPGGTA